jgi:hypothetical protein
MESKANITTVKIDIQTLNLVDAEKFRRKQCGERGVTQGKIVEAAIRAYLTPSEASGIDAATEKTPISINFDGPITDTSDILSALTEVRTLIERCHTEDALLGHFLGSILHAIEGATQIEAPRGSRGKRKSG